MAKSSPHPDGKDTKPKVKICCACPETKVRFHAGFCSGESSPPRTIRPTHPPTRPPLAQTKRDECIATHGPESTECAKLIEAHKVCLRKEGFHVE